jgi:hypothetical protein
MGFDLVPHADAGKQPRSLDKMLIQLAREHRGAELPLVVCGRRMPVTQQVTHTLQQVLAARSCALQALQVA